MKYEITYAIQTIATIEVEARSKAEAEQDFYNLPTKELIDEADFNKSFEVVSVERIK